MELNNLLSELDYKCADCGSSSWVYLHDDDWSNCDCDEGDCLRICDAYNPNDPDWFCEGVVEVIR